MGGNLGTDCRFGRPDAARSGSGGKYSGIEGGHIPSQLDAATKFTVKTPRTSESSSRAILPHALQP